MRRTRHPLIVAAGIAGVAGALLLGGCAAQPDATPGSSALAPAPSDETDAAGPVESSPPASAGIPADFVIPPCEDQVDAALVRSAFGDDVAFIADTTDTWKPVGPAAQAAFADAADATACLWGVPNSGNALSIAVARTADDGSGLMTALREASATFAEEAVGSAVVFTADGLENGDVTTAVTYVFDGPAWISVGGGALATAETSREIALAVHAGLMP